MTKNLVDIIVASIGALIIVAVFGILVGVFSGAAFGAATLIFRLLT